MRADGSAVATEAELGRRLAARAGEVVTAEVARTLRAFDDEGDVSPEAHRIVSTMAIRIAVGVLQRPVIAVEDDTTAETVATLFLPDD